MNSLSVLGCIRCAVMSLPLNRYKTSLFDEIKLCVLRIINLMTRWHLSNFEISAGKVTETKGNHCRFEPNTVVASTVQFFQTHKFSTIQVNRYDVHVQCETISACEILSIGTFGNF